MGWGEPDPRPPQPPRYEPPPPRVVPTDTLLAQVDRLRREAAELQERLDARAADLGRFTQATLGRIKTLERLATAMARIQDQVAMEDGIEDDTAVGTWTRQCLAGLPRVYVTKAGTVLTEDDLDRLAAEAERGYCTWGTCLGRVCGKPLPCPTHPAP